jgi:hypothetical protein
MTMLPRLTSLHAPQVLSVPAERDSRRAANITETLILLAHCNAGGAVHRLRERCPRIRERDRAVALRHRFVDIGNPFSNRASRRAASEKLRDAAEVETFA